MARRRQAASAVGFRRGVGREAIPARSYAEPPSRINLPPRSALTVAAWLASG
jgi:hypothetical protein